MYIPYMGFFFSFFIQKKGRQKMAFLNCQKLGILIIFWIKYINGFIYEININGSDILPTDHDCYNYTNISKYIEFNKNDELIPCDIISSTEGNSFLILNVNGTLSIFIDDVFSWSSCNEYLNISNDNITCHEYVYNSTLNLYDNGTLMIGDYWSRGNTFGDRLIISDDGYGILYTESDDVIWTTNTEFDNNGGEWELIFRHDCNLLEYYNIEMSRKYGTNIDRLYSKLFALSEPIYKHNERYLFKMVWPQNPNILNLVWKQKSNPISDETVVQFERLMDPYQLRFIYILT